MVSISRQLLPRLLKTVVARIAAMVTSGLHAEFHLEGGISEDGLGMAEGHKAVGLEVSGIVEWHCVRFCMCETTNRLVGVVSHMQRYVRELREENTPDGREMRLLLLLRMLVGRTRSQQENDIGVTMGTGTG